MLTAIAHHAAKPCRRDKLERRVELLQHALSSEALSLFPDFQQRLGVLRRYARRVFLPYVDSNSANVVSWHGAVAIMLVQHGSL